MTKINKLKNERKNLNTRFQQEKNMKRINRLKKTLKK